MMFFRTSITRLVGAFVIPFAVYAALLILERACEYRGLIPARFGDYLDYGSMAISAIAGFACLMRLPQPYALVLAIVYFPAMYYALTYWSLRVVWWVYRAAP